MFLYPTNGYRRVQSTRISQYHCCHVFTPLYINRTSCWASRVGAGAAEMWGWGPCGCPPYLIGELLSWPDSPRAATRAYTCPPDRMPPTSAPLPPLREVASPLSKKPTRESLWGQAHPPALFAKKPWGQNPRTSELECGAPFTLNGTSLLPPRKK